MSDITIFTLGSGRSGTTSLSTILQRNAQHHTVKHETNWYPHHPSMFGRPIYDHSRGDLDAVRVRLARKQWAIRRYPTRTYVETSHSFLKSYWDLALEFFPNTRVFRLIRNPLEVAVSEANRERYIDRWAAPLARYRGADGQSYRRWALTRREPIFERFDTHALTLFQLYFIQWIEIENRAQAFLDRFDMHGRCLTMHSPSDLNRAEVVAAIVGFANGHSPKAQSLVIPGAQNRTPFNPTHVGEQQRQECEYVLSRLPSAYLRIFAHAPYCDYPWAQMLQARQQDVTTGMATGS